MLPHIPLFWVTKEKLTEGRKAGRESKTKLHYFILYVIVINLGSCIRNVPQCAECLDHRTCQRCQEGFILLDSYWGPLCVTSCPDGFNKVQTEEHGLVCKSSKGMGHFSVTV